MNDTWGLLQSGSHDAAINMALDESLLLWHSRGEIPPTLRFYYWSKPTLSVGHFQKVDRGIDLDGIMRHGCQLVRRLTGGSAVLHDHELTYSVVVSEKKPYISPSIRMAYYELSKGIMAGFQQLGIHAEYSIPEEQFKQERSEVCFERPSDYEMLVDGKKISGHAQTRKQGVLLQHGSIPLTIDKDMMFDLFKFPSEKMRQRQRNAFSKKAVTIYEATGKPFSYAEVEHAFKVGVQKGLNVRLEPFELSARQWEEVHELAETKYRSEDWNLKFRKRGLANGKRVHKKA